MSSKRQDIKVTFGKRVKDAEEDYQTILINGEEVGYLYARRTCNRWLTVGLSASAADANPNVWDENRLFIYEYAVELGDAEEVTFTVGHNDNARCVLAAAKRYAKETLSAPAPAETPAPAPAAPAETPAPAPAEAKTQVTFGKVEREDAYTATTAIYLRGKAVGYICTESHHTGAYAQRFKGNIRVSNYTVHLETCFARFTVEEYGSARSALAAAKRYAKETLYTPNVETRVEEINAEIKSKQQERSREESAIWRDEITREILELERERADLLYGTVETPAAPAAEESAPTPPAETPADMLPGKQLDTGAAPMHVLNLTEVRVLRVIAREGAGSTARALEAIREHLGGSRDNARAWFTHNIKLGYVTQTGDTYKPLYSHNHLLLITGMELALRGEEPEERAAEATVTFMRDPLGGATYSVCLDGRHYGFISWSKHEARIELQGASPVTIKGNPRSSVKAAKDYVKRALRASSSTGAAPQLAKLF